MDSFKDTTASSTHEHAENSDRPVGDMDGASVSGDLKTRNGIVLVPQPSDDPNDPLNWSSFRKHAALFVIAYQALVCFVTVTTIVPGTLPIATEFGVTKASAIYLGSTPVLLYGVAPWFWSPASHFAGRRIVLLLSAILAMVGTLVAATAQTYGACMAGRVILGAGGSAFWTLGPACIDGMFFRHEKGSKIGMSTLAIVTASFVGGIVGGPIVDGLGWRASQWIPLIWIAAGFVAQIFLLPETIYHRSRHLPSSSAAGMSPPVKRSMWAQYGVSVPKQDMEREHGFWFIATRPFVLFRYPAVILPSIWFGIVFSMMVGITAVIPLIFEPQFGFSELDVGLASFSGLIGALLGEAWAGPSINYLTRRVTMRGKEFKPEIVLGALWPALIAAPGGLVMFGTSIQFGSAWITPLIGWGLYSFGVEVGTTTIQTYIMECYAPQRAEVSLVFNMFRNVMTWTVAFYIVPMIDNVGSCSPYCLFAGLIVFFFPFTMGILIWRGSSIREKESVPGWN